MEIFRYLIKISQYKRFHVRLLNIKLGFLFQIIDLFCFSFLIIYLKLLMEKYYFSPYESAYIIGINNAIITLIIFLILSIIPIEKNNSLYPIE